MRLLMLDNEFPPLGGGTGTVNRAILERFASIPNLEIDLITSALGSHYAEESFADRIKIFKVPVNNRDLHHSSNVELSQYALRAWRLSSGKHDQCLYDLCMAWSAV